MKLKIKLLDWSAGVPVVMLNPKTAEKLGIHVKDRITLSVGAKKLSSIVDTIKKIVKPNEIAVSSEAKEIMNLKNRQKIKIELTPPPRTLVYIKKKLNGERLTKKEIRLIIQDIVTNSLSEPEIALFISAMYEKGMEFNEIIYLIESILETGNKLKLKNKLIVDKHSIGGVAGRVSPLVISICSSTGLTMPKTSSRAITSPAGTADAMECLAKVDFSIEEIKKIISKTNACIVWGGGLGMVPADSKIIKIEKLLKIDPKSQLLASIMSKKLAVGSNHIIIHIPYGKSAKVNKTKALELEKDFKKIAKHFNIKLVCVLTKNNGPLGNGIGPFLEMIDVLKVLKREDSCHNLEKIAIEISGVILELTKKAKKGKGEELALEILNSGKAFEKFKAIIEAQQGKIVDLKPAKFLKTIYSSKNCKIKEIDNKKINFLARITGCPNEKSSGLYLHSHEGDNLKNKQKIITIYSRSKTRLRHAVEYYKKEKPIIFG